MSQGKIDQVRLQQLIAQGRAIVEDLRTNLSPNQVPTFHWNDLTNWQSSAIRFIEDIDGALVDDITRLAASFDKPKVYAALTSTMLALMALTGSDT